ncbi:MAG TPA: hypothetical protein VI565_09225 [Burkholderiales bacterium]|nr:hypothetical protein [Burkholderiales bacterium]
MARRSAIARRLLALRNELPQIAIVEDQKTFLIAINLEVIPMVSRISDALRRRLFWRGRVVTAYANR